MISTVRSLRQTHLRWVLLTSLLILAFGSLFLTGCSQSPVDSGADSSLASVEAFEGVIENPSTISVLRGLEPEPVSAPVIVDSDAAYMTFGPDGGSMSLNIDGDEVVFFVPAGALDEEVTIHIAGYKGVDQYGKVNFQYDCLPTGLQFNQTANFYQPWSYGGLTVKSFFKSDDPFSVWTFEEIVPVVNEMATIHVDHFSKYGISN